jgi:hypothetical protein
MLPCSARRPEIVGRSRAGSLREHSRRRAPGYSARDPPHSFMHFEAARLES